MKSSKEKNDYGKQYYLKHRKERIAYDKQYQLKNKDKRKNQVLKRKFNITLEQYNELFLKQGGYCSICGTHQRDLRYSLCVDHDHKTGENRELLCSKCNLILGNANDDVIILENCIKYLKKYKSLKN